MQKLCCVRTRQHPLPGWSHKFVLSSPTHFSTNSHPFLVGIVIVSMDVDMAQIKEYVVFKDYGKAKWEGKTIANALWIPEDQI